MGLSYAPASLDIPGGNALELPSPGDPGVIDVFDSRALEPLETVDTERGAHTIAFDRDRNKVYAFLPQTHRAAVYIDTGEVRV